MCGRSGSLSTPAGARKSALKDAAGADGRVGMVCYRLDSTSGVGWEELRATCIVIALRCVRLLSVQEIFPVAAEINSHRSQGLQIFRRFATEDAKYFSVLGADEGFFHSSVSSRFF